MSPGSPVTRGETVSYLFALIPAGSADSTAQAIDVVREIGSGPRSEVPESICVVLTDLAASEAAVFSVGGRPADARGAVIATHDPALGALQELLSLTKDRGVAVYDSEFQRLYDPRESIAVDVILPGDVLLPYLSRSLLESLLDQPYWPYPESPYFIVARADQIFIQAYRHEDGTFQLEHRDGGPGAHFEFQTRDQAVVADLMWAWATADSSWRTTVAWSFLDLGTAC